MSTTSDNNNPSSSPGDTAKSIGFTLFGSFFSSLSLILMKWAHNRVQKQNMKLAAADHKSAFTDITWVGGFLALIAGSMFNIVALGYGNQLLLASTSSISIIFNTIMAVFLLKEPLIKSDMIAIAMICTGSVLFLCFAKNQEIKLTEKKLFKLYLRPLSVIYIVLSICFIVFVYWLDKSFKKKIKTFYDSMSPHLMEGSL